MTSPISFSRGWALLDSTLARRRFIIFLVVAMTVWGLTDVRSRARLDPRAPWDHKTDLTVYTLAGAAMIEGRDPYAIVNARGWAYPYPPLLAILVAPLAKLDPQAQGLVWFFLNVAICLAVYIEARRMVAGLATMQRDGAADVPFPSWLGWAALAAVAVPALNCLQRGQVGIIKLYFLMLGFRLILQSRGSWPRAMLGGIAMALPVAIKVTPILPVGVVLLSLAADSLAGRRGERRVHRGAGAALGVALGLALFFFIIPAAIIGWRDNLRHLETFHRSVIVHTDDASGTERFGNPNTLRNQSLSNAVYRLGNWIAYVLADGPDDRLVDMVNRPAVPMPMDSRGAVVVLLVVRIALCALLMAAALLAGRRRDDLALACLFGMACAATLIVAPIARGHYFVLLLPALMLLPWYLLREGRPRAAAAAAGFPVMLIDIHYALLYGVGRAGLLGIGMTIWYIAAMVVLIRGPKPRAVVHSGREAPGYD